MSSYLDIPKLPTLPKADNNYTKISRFTMGGNDKYGCCVVAGAAHTVQVWTSMAANEFIIPDHRIIKSYFGLTNGADSGLNVLEFLKFWRKNQLWGQPLGAFVSINPSNIVQMQYAVYLFGAVFTGLSLPLSAKDQSVWDVPSGGDDSIPGSWGGHLTICGEYNANHFINYTWGEKQPMTNDFVKNYCDEAYGLLSVSWFGKNHKSPDGFAYRDLLSDLTRIAT